MCERNDRNRDRLPLARPSLGPAPHWDLPRNPSMYPDWESNQQHFSLQAGAQPTEPQQPGPFCLFFHRKGILRGVFCV